MDFNMQKYETTCIPHAVQNSTQMYKDCNIKFDNLKILESI